jgi:BCD family chlorophyll transporter-like MFS transporter
MSGVAFKPAKVARPIVRLNAKLASKWARVGTGFLPFAEAATAELPLGQLLRLSLFQVTVGMAAVLLVGTLNRVMIVELGVPSWLVAVMISLPLIFAPFRAVVGFRSDNHRSVLGWKRVPFLWLGTMVQFGGLAIMPFALIVLSGDTSAPVFVGRAAAGLAFLMVGAGLHTTQTVGLALATDLSPPEKHPQVVALLCMMLLLGMIFSALTFGAVLRHFSEVHLIQVIQGSAVVTIVLNAVALWKQEPRRPAETAHARATPSFAQSWAEFDRAGDARRRLVALGLGTAAFSMQDILLEPYGGQVLHLSVGSTTGFSAMLAFGGLIGFATAAKLLAPNQYRPGMDAYRLAGMGAVVGLFAFAALIFAAPAQSTIMFAAGVSLIGLGAGLFAHCTLTAAMAMAGRGQIGLALGIWGAVQASAAGIAVASGGLLRDGIGGLAAGGSLGAGLVGQATGYGAVYLIEIVLLFATLVAVGPLVRSPVRRPHAAPPQDATFAVTAG